MTGQPALSVELGTEAPTANAADNETVSLDDDVVASSPYRSIPILAYSEGQQARESPATIVPITVLPTPGSRFDTLSLRPHTRAP